MQAGVRRTAYAVIVTFNAVMMSSFAVPGTATAAGAMAARGSQSGQVDNGAARGGPEGMVSWWRGEGNTSDEIGANPGIDRGGVTYTDGVVGQAFHFGGSSYVEVPRSISLEPATVTVMLWIRGPRPGDGGTYVLSKGASACNADSSYAFFTVADRLDFYASDGGSNITHSEPAQIDLWDGFWHHIVGVYDGDFVTLYVDGQEQLPAAPASFTAINYLLDDHQTFYIGAYFSSCIGYIFEGDADEVRLFSRALNADEIGSIYDSEKVVAALDWDEPEDAPLAPPQNLSVRLVGAAVSAGAPAAGARGGSAVTGYKVYRANNPNTPPSAATFYASVPATQTTTRVPVQPGGSFFVITAEYDENESDPSNESGAGGPGATVRKLRVKPSRVVIKGRDFTSTVIVFVDGIPFAAPATVKQGLKVLQESTLITGTTLGQYLLTKRQVEFAVINSDQTITRVPYTAP